MPTAYSNKASHSDTYTNRASWTTTYDYLLMESGGYILQEDAISKFIIWVNSGPTSYSNRVTI